MSENTKTFTYIPLLNAPQVTILSDLGKATKRGIKRCPKCGTFNGTRGVMCKNVNCETIFKDYPEKRKINLDAVKLVGIVKQIYSVRVRETGPDYRGFVQLPLLLSHEENRLTENAICFVDSCQRLFDDSILKCHEMETEATISSPLCIHIKSALKSVNTAIPMDFKKEVLGQLKVLNEVKEKLWLLDKEKEGPLVQRVSKAVMAVKCQVSPKHPLGYLHFMFGSSKGKEVYDKFCCSCNEIIISARSNTQAKCIHYYACICALASQPKFSDEFSNLLNNDFLNNRFPVVISNIKSSEAKMKNPPSSKEKASHRILGKKVCEKTKKAKVKQKNLMPKVFPIEIKVLNEPSCEKTPQSGAVWKFLEWLSFVTESVNRTMQFENYGILNSLIFHIPQSFFEELKARIPDFYNQHSCNLSGYGEIYHIMNILHLKQIFDTPEVKLKISKRFVHDNQSGYVEYDENSENTSCQANFIFFLNVGLSTVDENDNVNNSFMIEWIPNISQVTKVGQLKLQYKYGRKNI